MTFNIILYHTYSQKKKIGKNIPVTWYNPNPGRSQIPKKKKSFFFNFYLKVFKFRKLERLERFENFENYENMTSHLMSPREIDDVKKFLRKFVKNGLDNIPAKF